MRKIALFAFNGEMMCFVHVLLNALDMKEKGFDVRIVIEGSATKLIPDLVAKGNPMFPLYEKVKMLGLIEGACKACSNKMGTIKAIENESITFLDEMNGHPSMARFQQEGFTVITF